jgi:hypothetical protein
MLSVLIKYRIAHLTLLVGIGFTVNKYLPWHSIVNLYAQILLLMFISRIDGMVTGMKALFNAANALIARSQKSSEFKVPLN